MRSYPKRHLRLAPVALAAALVVGNSGAAHAQTCFGQVRDCFERAAGRGSYWEAVVASLICEGDFLDCVRRELIGR